MFVVSVNVWVKSGREEEFIEATRSVHEASLTEPGCVKLDVLRCLNDTKRFCLYEVFRDQDAQQAHEDTTHYKEWLAAIGPWMERPQRSIKHESLYPADDDF